MNQSKQTRETVSSLKERMNAGIKARYTALLGEEGVDSLLHYCISGIPTYLRVNTLRASVSSVMKELEDEGILTKQHHIFPSVLEVLKGGRKLGTTLPFLHGEYFIQDLASVITVLALEPQPGEIVFDCCASPGGKTTLLYQEMKGKGTIIANDFNKKRLVSLSLNLTRMGVSNAIILNEDMRNPEEPLLLEESFDRVLVDAPCTGEGLISKFRERLYRDTEKELREFPVMQLKILENAFNSLKPGGVLLYSTCSTTIHENEHVIQEFLREHSNAVLEEPSIRGLIKQLRIEMLEEKFPEIHAKTIRLFPHVHRTNGFFIARVKKIEM